MKGELGQHRRNEEQIRTNGKISKFCTIRRKRNKNGGIEVNAPDHGRRIRMMRNENEYCVLQNGKNNIKNCK